MTESRTLTVVPDPKPPISWWLLKDRAYNAMWPVRRVIFRRYYEVCDLREQIWNLDYQLRRAIELATQHAEITRRVLEKAETVADLALADQAGG